MGKRKKLNQVFYDNKCMHTAILHTLKELRRSSGLTQQELSIKLGRHRDIVNKIECERFQPSLDVIRDYGIYFNKSVSEIIALAEERVKNVFYKSA